MSEVKLLPCPWCGEELENGTVSEGSTFRWRKVDGCCADGPEVRHNTMADDQSAAEIESTKAAIAAWNTRANLAERDAEVEALRAEVAEWKAVAKWEKEQHDRLLNEGRELTARAERLAEALLRYGRHEHDCATRHDAAHKDRPVCDCGLSAALEQENDDE